MIHLPITGTFGNAAEVTYPPLWFHLEDVESGAFPNDDGEPRLRTCATGGNSCPAVFVFKEPRLKVNLDMHWQFFMAAINYLMTPADVAVELDYSLAFCNQTGLRKPGQPRRNYLEGKDLSAPEDPRFDKDRTCSRSKMTGVEAYSLTLALGEMFHSARRGVRVSFRKALTVNNVLRVTTFDGNQPPPLKPGRSYPQRVQDINPDDYLYNPRDHFWMFFAANTVGSVAGGDSRVYPFPRGKVYPWMVDGWRYTWFPHVSREEIRYPLSRLRRLTPGTPIPSYYRAA